MKHTLLLTILLTAPNLYPVTFKNTLSYSVLLHTFKSSTKKRVEPRPPHRLYPGETYSWHGPYDQVLVSKDNDQYYIEEFKGLTTESIIILTPDNFGKPKTK